MSHHIVPPLAIALLAGLVFPVLLARAGWVHWAPRLAVGTWGVLGLAFTTGLALSLLQLLLPHGSGHRLAQRVESCVPWDGQGCRVPGRPELPALSLAELSAVAAAAGVLLVPGVMFCQELLRARRRRVEHARGLRLVGRPDAGLRATVVEHEVPVVYCLPGRAPQVVVTTGALHTLTQAQLSAALRHEQAHITGRHHVVIAAVEGFGRVFRRLPLTRLARSQVPLLLEMTADDHALRHCSRDELATALYSMAAARPTVKTAFAAGGPSTAIRIRRLLTRRSGGHPVLHGVLTVGLAVCTVVPLATACCFFYR